MGRDRGKGKHRGGGGERFYVENPEEVALRDARMQVSLEERMKRRNEEDEDDDDDDEPEDQTKKATQKAAPVAKKQTDSNAVALKPASEKSTKKYDGLDDVETTEPQLSRREREAIEAERKKADYERRHLAGETEQAKADLARLALVRQRREEAAKKRESEGRAPGYSQFGVESSSDTDSDEEGSGLPKIAKMVVSKPVVAAPVISEASAKKKAAALATTDESATVTEEKLKSMDIKKMNADTVKEHLKARNLSIQGQKKDLMQRLIDFEAAKP